MSWQQWITINSGETFEGTVEQFENSFFSNATPDAITAWCDDHGYDVTIEQKFIFPVIGYGNKTAMHPLGSYIGFERGPTVFASPLTHVSIAEDVVDTLMQQLDDLRTKFEMLQQNTTRAVFKRIVNEAMKPTGERAESAGLTSCAIPFVWFKPKGKYHGLIDKIDEMPEETVVPQMAWFIADCYKQR